MHFAFMLVVKVTDSLAEYTAQQCKIILYFNRINIVFDELYIFGNGLFHLEGKSCLYHSVQCGCESPNNTF